MIRSADIAGPFRISLDRSWDNATEQDPICTVIGLNPSTADAEVDDPTIRRCLHFARQQGLRRLRMLNLFAFRATSPTELRRVPLSDRNPPNIDERLRVLLNTRGCVIAAWGVLKASERIREDRVISHCLHLGRPLLRLGELTQGGFPRHPLYLPNDAVLSTYRELLMPAWGKDTRPGS